MKIKFFLSLIVLFSCVNHNEEIDIQKSMSYKLQGEIEAYLIKRVNTINLEENQEVGIMFCNLDYEDDNFSIRIVTPLDKTKLSYLLKISNKRVLLSNNVSIPMLNESDYFFCNLPDDFKLNYVRSSQESETIHFNFDGKIKKIITQ